MEIVTPSGVRGSGTEFQHSVFQLIHSEEGPVLKGDPGYVIVLHDPIKWGANRGPVRGMLASSSPPHQAHCLAYHPV